MNARRPRRPHRRHATGRQPRQITPHEYADDGGSCAVCLLLAGHIAHDPQAIAEHDAKVTARQHEHARRYDPQEDQ